MKRIFTILGIGLLSFTTFSQAALNFDGSNDVIDVGAGMNAVLDPLNTITVEAWVKSSTTSGLGVIVGNYNSSSVNSQMQFLLRRDNEHYTFYIDDGTGYSNVNTSASSVIIGEWQHVAGVWDGSELRIYLDGVLDGTVTGVIGTDFYATSNPVRIGNNAMNERFFGDMDEIRIWSSVRTETELLDNMNCLITPDKTGLVAAYNFNDGMANSDNSSVVTLHDYTNSGYNGTMLNFGLTGTTSNFVDDKRTDYLSIKSSIGSTIIADRLSTPMTGDYNNDGYVDLLAIAENTDLRMYLNDGNGNFSSFTVIGNGSFNKNAVADIDNDGDDDIIFRPSGFSYAVVYINDGVGNFSDLGETLLNGDGSVSIIEVFDVNNDNKLDIILGNDNSGTIDETEIWLNTGTTGSASFTFSTGLTNTLGAANSITFGDVDGDNDIDIAIGASSWNGKLFLNDNNSGNWNMQSDFGGYCGGVRLLDWDQNGTLDLVNTDTYNNWGVRVRYNDGAGNFDANTTVILPGQTGFFGVTEFEDLNGDGFLDIISSSWGGYGQVFISNGCVLTSATDCAYRLGRTDNGVAIADFDGNGKPDIFCAARDNKSTFSMNYLNDVVTPPLPVITSTTGDEICEDETASISFTSTGATVNNWYSNSDGTGLLIDELTYEPTTLTNGANKFYAQSENANGCKSRIDSAVVILNESPEVEVNSASILTLNCNGDMDGDIQVDVTLNGTATSATFDWDNDGTGDNDDSEDIVNLAAGVYNLTLTDDNGCTKTLQAEVIEPNAISSSAVIGIETFGNDGGINLTISGGTAPYTYSWTGDNSFSVSTEDATNIVAGTYEVNVTDANGCTFSEQFVVGTTVGLNESLDLGISIYPNPNNGEFFITSNQENLKVSIYSIDGKVILNNLNVTQAIQPINLNGVNSGIYIVKVTDGTNQKNIRLIIE